MPKGLAGSMRSAVLYRLQPTVQPEAALPRHCADARFRWKLAVKQGVVVASAPDHLPAECR